MLIKATHSHTFTPSPFHPHPQARQSERVRDRERAIEKQDHLTSNTLLYFVSSDFEMRLEETQVNEEKWQAQYILSHPIKHQV